MARCLFFTTKAGKSLPLDHLPGFAYECVCARRSRDAKQGCQHTEPFGGEGGSSFSACFKRPSASSCLSACVSTASPVRASSASKRVRIVADCIAYCIRQRDPATALARCCIFPPCEYLNTRTRWRTHVRTVCTWPSSLSRPSATVRRCERVRHAARGKNRVPLCILAGRVARKRALVSRFNLLASAQHEPGCRCTGASVGCRVPWGGGRVVSEQRLTRRRRRDG